MSNIRYPVIALDYSERHKALKKELMIDYSTGNIYVVSAVDKNIIFDVTSKILEQIDELSGDNVTIIIEGIGEVNLTSYINQLSEIIKDSVHIKDPGTDFSYIIKDASIDKKSLKIFNGNIQLDNYLSSDNLSIPQKTSTGLRWIPISEFISGITAVDSGYSEVDGDLKTVPLITVANNKIYLSSHAQNSYNLTGNFANVFLPITADEYSVIKWEVMQIQSNMELIFEDTVYLSDKIPTDITVNYSAPGITLTIPKCTDVLKVKYKFMFETFDNGKSWILDIIKYNNSQKYNI